MKSQGATPPGGQRRLFDGAEAPFGGIDARSTLTIENALLR
jgi:hypothetical protein